MKLITGLALVAILSGASVATAQTVVPGQARKMDANNNGWADVGVVVNGHYTAFYAYDDGGCDYVINYRGRFEDTAYLDTGWIQNHITCSGVEQGTYQYLIVHQTDPRYTGNPDYAVWDEWEYFVLVESGSGNVVRRPRP